MNTYWKYLKQIDKINPKQIYEIVEKYIKISFVKLVLLKSIKYKKKFWDEKSNNIVDTVYT